MFSRSPNTVVPTITIHANFGATETSYVSGQEIYGQGEWPDLDDNHLSASSSV